MSEAYNLLIDLQNRLADQDFQPLDPEQALLLAKLPPEHTLSLFALAQLVKAGHEQPSGPAFICSIVNAKSGRCVEDCSFCAQSAHYAANAPVFDLLSEEEMVAAEQSATGDRVKRLGFVTSGSRLSERNFAAFLIILTKLGLGQGPALCASLGQLSPQRASQLKQAGIIRYHHNLETSASFFPNICTTHTYSEDLDSVRAAKAAGLQVCCGGIFGLGEGWPDRIELSATLAALEVDSIPVNFLNPIPGTPLQSAAPLDVREALRIIAILRLMHPRRDIIVCGGRPTILGAWQSWLFMAGANGLMSGDYLTTKGRKPGQDKKMMKCLGLVP